MCVFVSVHFETISFVRYSIELGNEILLRLFAKGHVRKCSCYNKPYMTPTALWLGCASFLHHQSKLFTSLLWACV